MLPEIFLALTGFLSPHLCYQLSEVLKGIIQTQSSLNMLQISRSSELSYRTVQRFFSTSFEWDTIRSKLFKEFVFRPDTIYIAAIDEVVEGKCGKSTYGISQFYSSIFKKPIASVSCVALTLIDVKKRSSYPLGVVQIIKNAADAVRSAALKAKTAVQKQKKAVAKTDSSVVSTVGRPKGVKNKAKTTVDTPVEEKDTIQYRHTKLLITNVITALKGLFKSPVFKYVVMDAGFGHQAIIELITEQNLHAISKLKKTAALFYVYTGAQKGKKPKIYGNKIDVYNIPTDYFDHEIIEDDVKTQVFRINCYNKNIKATPSNLINVVVLVHTQISTKKKSHNILFSTDLDLAAKLVIEYYQLRWEIEIDFRDCKQYFGLSHFKNYKQQQVTNALNLPFTAKLWAQILQEQLAQNLDNDAISILDVKAFCKAQFFLKKLKNMYPNDPLQFFNLDNIINLAACDAIHIKKRA
jgi:putative transposase